MRICLELYFGFVREGARLHEAVLIICARVAGKILMTLGVNEGDAGHC